MQTWPQEARPTVFSLKKLPTYVMAIILSPPPGSNWQAIQTEQYEIWRPANNLKTLPNFCHDANDGQ